MAMLSPQEQQNNAYAANLARYNSPTDPYFQKSLMTPSAMPQLTDLEQGLLTPSSVGSPQALSQFQGAYPAGNMGGMGAGGFGGILGGALGGGSSNPGNIASYTSGITAGNLPQSVINQASSAIMSPVGSVGSGGASNQIADMARQTQSAANVNMLRGAAQAGAQMNMARQNAQANSGLGWGNYLNNLNQRSTQQLNSYLQPVTGALLRSLTA